MERINLKENLKKGISEEDIIKNFFLQIYEYTIKNKTQIKNELDSIVIKQRCIDPRRRQLYVYAVCEQEVIDKLLSFDSEYVAFKKELKKIKKLRNHRKLEYDFYTIEYNEAYYQYHRIIFNIIKQDYSKGANYVKNVLIAEDDLYFAKEILDCFNIKF